MGSAGLDGWLLFSGTELGGGAGSTLKGMKGRAGAGGGRQRPGLEETRDGAEPADSRSPAQKDRPPDPGLCPPQQDARGGRAAWCSALSLVSSPVGRG